MGRPPHQKQSARKQFDLPNEMWDEISSYRHENRIPSEAEAVRRLMRAALDATAKRPLKKATKP